MSRRKHGLGVFVGLMLASGMVRAEPEPTPVAAEQFAVGYYVTDEAGDRVREMDEADRERFLNRARCECGQEVQVQIRLQAGDGAVYDNTKLIEAFLGPMCAVAEVMPIGEYSRCVRLATQTIQPYINGVIANVHPGWLTAGVDSESGEVRDPNNASTKGSCAGSGVAGVWMCAQTNSTSGCQEDEFFLSFDDEHSPLRYRFEPPTTLPVEMTVEPYSGGGLVEWVTATPGYIDGYRVLCAEHDSGAPPARPLPPPDVVDASAGEHYFNAHNLCGDEPFSTYKAAPAEPTGPAACGDGVVQNGEACDDGPDNSDDGLCGTDCELRVAASLHALDWSHMCSEAARFNEDSVFVTGLENGKTYDVVLVTFDAFGNPRAYPKVLQVTPDAGLPPVPGVDEGCGCRSDAGSGPWLLLPFAAAWRRRRR